MKYLLEGEETERLTFRLLQPWDFETWLTMFKEQQVAKLLGVENIPSPFEQCKHWFDKMEYRYQHDLGGMNVLIDKKTGHFIGQSGLLVQEIDGETELEVAYSIMPAFWKNGYATEAARKCRDFAFEHNFSSTLISIIHKDNLVSEHVARKNRMNFVKTVVFRERPVNVFGIRKSEWIPEQHRMKQEGA